MRRSAMHERPPWGPSHQGKPPTRLASAQHNAGTSAGDAQKSLLWFVLQKNRDRFPRMLRSRHVLVSIHLGAARGDSCPAPRASCEVDGNKGCAGFTCFGAWAGEGNKRRRRQRRVRRAVLRSVPGGKIDPRSSVCDIMGARWSPQPLVRARGVRARSFCPLSSRRSLAHLVQAVIGTATGSRYPAGSASSTAPSAGNGRGGRGGAGCVERSSVVSVARALGASSAREIAPMIFLLKHIDCYRSARSFGPSGDVQE